MGEPAGKISIIPLTGLPLIEKGDDLVEMIIEALKGSGEELMDHDVLVISHKIVSKSEGTVVNLDDVAPSEEAAALAKEVGKDPRMVHLILEESNRIVRKRYGLLIAEHKRGWVCANAGLDFSNIPGDGVALLPKDPDGTAETIRTRIRDHLRIEIAVLICDSQGRPFRNGIIGVALGCAGMGGLVSKIGCEDLYGYRLQNTEIALADQLTSAALLVIGESNEAVPVAIIRGLHPPCKKGTAKELIRSEEKDLFR